MYHYKLAYIGNTWTQVISLQLCGTTRDLTLLGQLTIQFFQSETGDYSLQKIEHAGEIISIIYRDEDWVKGPTSSLHRTCSFKWVHGGMKKVRCLPDMCIKNLIGRQIEHRSVFTCVREV